MVKFLSSITSSTVAEWRKLSTIFQTNRGLFKSSKCTISLMHSLFCLPMLNYTRQLMKAKSRAERVWLKWSLRSELTSSKVCQSYSLILVMLLSRDLSLKESISLRRNKTWPLESSQLLSIAPTDIQSENWWLKLKLSRVLTGKVSSCQLGCSCTLTFWEPKKLIEIWRVIMFSSRSFSYLCTTTFLLWVSK